MTPLRLASHFVVEKTKLTSWPSMPKAGTGNAGSHKATARSRITMRRYGRPA